MRTTEFTTELLDDMIRRLDGYPYVLVRTHLDRIRIDKLEGTATPVATIYIERARVSALAIHGGSKYLDDHEILVRTLREALTPNFAIIT